MIDKALVEATIKEHLGSDLKVQFCNKIKNNGVAYDSVVIAKPGDPIAPSFNFSPDMSTDEVVKNILKGYENAKANQPNAPILNKLEKEYVLDNVYPVLCNREKNLMNLADCVHRKFLDLEITYRCKVEQDDDNNIASFRITKSLCKYFGIEESELHDAAIKNAEPKGFTFITMRGITNDTHINGAGVIVNSEKMHELLGNDDYYILPSSIHEVLLIPCSESIDVNDLKQMVMCVNASEVSEEDYLSDSVYLYRRGALEVVA